jgi:hypothetical protein
VAQGRFSRITEEQVRELQASINACGQRFLERAGRHKAPSAL